MLLASGSSSVVVLDVLLDLALRELALWEQLSHRHSGWHALAILGCRVNEPRDAAVRGLHVRLVVRVGLASGSHAFIASRGNSDVSTSLSTLFTQTFLLGSSHSGGVLVF